MDPITLIVTALAAGSSAGAISALQDDVKAAEAAYSQLRGLVTTCVAGQPGAELVLAQYEEDPRSWEPPLVKMLTDADAASDHNLLAVAGALLELADAVGAAEGKYHVTISGSQGTQVGDHNVQVNRFGA
jgi:RIP homotypic interaction motif